LLCADIRGFLIENISRTGGHLGSNLGIVELTAALHYIFDSPKDKIIWDVGHQSYAHKIITGRKDKFVSLRKLGGISGFPKLSESEHDVFGTGHSSTALSAAVGVAQANILNKSAAHVIAVIGDGSFTGGLVYEALNNAKDCKNLIVILNDNEMSISKNVGAMADYLANIRTTKKYYKLKRGTKNILGAIPLIGKPFVAFLQHIKKLLRQALYHSTFFAQMGFDFLGPVDGHDSGKLLSVLREAKTREKPVFILVNTKKGKGYEKAEQSDSKYHSVGKFDIDEGVNKSDYGYSENFGDKICDTAALNEKICAITAAMTEGTGLENFRRDYPERFFDVGIAEAHAATFAAGLAAGGLLPVFAVYSSFMQRAYDNIIHDIALQNLHVIFCVDRAGLCGEDGATHHGIFDAAFLNHTPNLLIYSPASYAEFNRSFDFCVNKTKSPAFIRYPKGAENPQFNKKLADLNCENNLDYLYKQNKGAQFLVVSYGQISEVALEVYEKLNNSNKPADFLKLNKIKPIDYILPEIINSGSQCVVFIEEGIENGGISQLIASKLNNKKTKIFAVDNFVEHGSNEELFELCGFNPEKIYNDIINFSEL
jgi:1-deoxy-D-xylulose-5-phosphate synthase